MSATKEIIVVAYPAAAIKMVVVEDGVGIDEAICWAPEFVSCTQELLAKYSRVKKISIFGPASYIKNFEQRLKSFVNIPIEIKGL
jgi:actin-related protein